MLRGQVPANFSQPAMKNGLSKNATDQALGHGALRHGFPCPVSPLNITDGMRTERRPIGTAVERRSSVLTTGTLANPWVRDESSQATSHADDLGAMLRKQTLATKGLHRSAG